MSLLLPCHVHVFQVSKSFLANSVANWETNILKCREEVIHDSLPAVLVWIWSPSVSCGSLFGSVTASAENAFSRPRFSPPIISVLKTGNEASTSISEGGVISAWSSLPRTLSRVFEPDKPLLLLLSLQGEKNSFGSLLPIVQGPFLQDIPQPCFLASI